MIEDSVFEHCYHVYPINDERDHILKLDWDVNKNGPTCLCKCNPKIKEEGVGYLIVHNSFDGREGVEIVNEILNNKK